MPYNSTAPDGTKSVKDNESILQDNTTYVETTSKVDHYFNEDANNDGHHKKIEMPNISSIAGDPFALDANGDPTVLSTGQECMFYTREKTATEAPDSQEDEPFAYTIKDPTGTPVNQYMQLGSRVLVHFDVGLSSGGHAIDIKYSHNVATVVRNGVGDFTVTFNNATPSNNYIPYGMAMRRASGNPSGSNALFLAPVISNTKADAFSTTFFRFKTWSSSDSPRDPSSVTLSIMGG